MLRGTDVEPRGSRGPTLAAIQGQCGAARQLLDHVKAGTVNYVVVYKVDRLSRSLLDFSRIHGDPRQAGRNLRVGDPEISGSTACNGEGIAVAPDKQPNLFVPPYADEKANARTAG